MKRSLALFLRMASMAGLLSVPAFAETECVRHTILLALEPASRTPGCQELGIEGQFNLDVCPGGSGLLVGNGRSRFLESYESAWFHRQDQFDHEEKRRLLEVLWLDPENRKYSYASSAQVNGGYFERVLDCKGELQLLATQR